MELVRCKSRVDKRKAIIMLDEMPSLLASKGLKSSEDVRSSVLSLDVEYSSLHEQKDILEAIFENLKGKTRNLEHSLYSIKTITQYRVTPRYNTDDFTNKEFSIGNEGQ
jgi:uncharacterized protein related to proFAR isomerase